MCTPESRAVRGLLIAAVILLCTQAPVEASTPPPTIGEIVGTYAVKYKQVNYAFANSIVSRWNYVVTWDISPVSATEVQVYISTFNDTFLAHYENGLLVWANGDDANHPAGYAGVGYAVFSGAAGKVKFKGRGGYDSLGTWGMCETDVFSGRMTTGGPLLRGAPVMAGRTAARATTIDVTGAGAASAASFPAIDDLVGTYAAGLKGATYHIQEPRIVKASVAFTLKIEKIDEETVVLDTGGDLLMGHYENGVLMIANVDDSDLAINSLFMILSVKGAQGKVSIKGWTMATRDIGGDDPEFDTADLTATRTGSL
jgi:hypothetical protein